MKIVADNTIPFLKGIAEPVAEVEYLASSDFSPRSIRDADVLIVRSIDKCTRALLEGSRVRLITTATIGFDHIDTAYCAEAGITWKNAPGCNAVSVAQYVLSSLITVALRRGEPLQGKTLGIVGAGHVGQALEKLCTAYGMYVLRNDPPRAEAEGSAGFVSLRAIAEEADIISFHTPLTKGGPHPTYHLADAHFFGMARRKPWFVNASRGAVHDTPALVSALKQGKIGAAVIDCWENEPQIDHELLRLADIATPHIAGFSADGKANATRACLQNIEQFFGVRMERIGEVVPPAPACPVIDLDEAANHRVEYAVLRSIPLEKTDRMLREMPEGFEKVRGSYPHPREFAAYTVKHASAEERALLEGLGFVL